MNKFGEDKKNYEKKGNKGKKPSYGPHNFKFRSKEQKLFALGFSDLDKTTRIHLITHYEKFYKEIATPEPDDWLWEHREDEQTFNQFLRQVINAPTKTKNTIYLANLDNDEYIEENIDLYRTVIEAYYPGITTKIYTNNNSIDSESLFKHRQLGNYDQINASDINNYLKVNKPKDCLYLVALTSQDLWDTSSEYLYGLANDGNGCCVISTRRFCDEITEFYKEQTSEFIVSVKRKVIIQTILHEIGHLFGLAHCIYFNCNMNGGNNMKETLAQAFELCPVCLRKVFRLLKFDILSRFNTLKETLTKVEANHFSEEICWFEKRISDITAELSN